ncbi:MAG: ATP-binding protein [Dehalococcoidia bacterium]
MQIPRVFTPGSPIDHKDFLAGRLKERDQAIAAVSRVGQHAAIYGERGVGKTSLAGLVHQFWLEVSKDHSLIAVRINCDPLDDYPTIWANVAEEIRERLPYIEGEEEESGAEPRQEFFRLREQLESVIAGQATPNIIRRMFQQATDYTFIVVVDEFDRLNSQEAIGLMADTIKTLSDHQVNATLIIVGVADRVDDLMHEHGSIDRALIQVLVPRMTTEELDQIVSNGLHRIGMEIEAQALSFTSRIAQGLPYYAHLLGLTSSLRAITDNRIRITLEDVIDGLRDAVNNAQESVQSAYYRATVSPRKESLYRQVLLACTLAQVDELGYFYPAAVREPLTRIMGRPYDIPSYLSHLNALSSSERGGVLQKTGEQRRRRYRFADPLLRPYVILRGLSEGLIKPQDA